MQAGLTAQASQHSRIIQEVGLRKVHHDTSLREISDAQRDFLANANSLAEPQSLNLNRAGDVDEEIGPESPTIDTRIREECLQPRHGRRCEEMERARVQVRAGRLVRVFR